jgi:hypothetical protein
MGKGHRRSLLLLLRLWPDDEGQGPTAWRGRLQYTSSGEAYEFDNWPALIALLEAALAGPPYDPSKDRDFPTEEGHHERE